jgi:hypothetical protein
LSLRIARVLPATESTGTGETTQVETVLTTPVTIFELLRQAVDRHSPYHTASEAGVFAGMYAVNRTRGEFIPLIGGRRREVIVHGVRIVWSDNEVGIRQGGRPGQVWTPPAGWLTDVAVAAVWIHPEAQFSREVTQPLSDLR